MNRVTFGRSRHRRPQRLSADKAYPPPHMWWWCRQRRIACVMPSRRNMFRCRSPSPQPRRPRTPPRPRNDKSCYASRPGCKRRAGPIGRPRAEPHRPSENRHHIKDVMCGHEAGRASGERDYDAERSRTPNAHRRATSIHVRDRRSVRRLIRKVSRQPVPSARRFHNATAPFERPRVADVQVASRDRHFANTTLITEGRRRRRAQSELFSARAGRSRRPSCAASRSFGHQPPNAVGRRTRSGRRG